MYADDTVLFSESTEDLLNMLNELRIYCEKWNLAVNSQKTNVIIFRKGHNIRNQTVFMYNGNALNMLTYLRIQV